MRKFAILAALLLSLSLQARDRKSADSSCFTYIGRTQVQNGTVSFDWSGVTAVVHFKGKYLEMNYKDSGTTYVNVWVDREPSATSDYVLALGGEALVPVAENLRNQEHTVYIQKRTEGECGCLSITSFVTDGSFLQARGLKDRKILFIGDSYTCGYGTEKGTRFDPFSAETENCNYTYAAIIGRIYDADIHLVSHSGRGVCRNYADAPVALMPEKYSRVFDYTEAAGPAWDASAFVPDIVVIYLGTNDFSTEKQPTMESWCQRYALLIGQIRKDFGADVPVLCMASPALEMLPQYVKTAVERCGQPNVHWMALIHGVYNEEDDLGASWHPNYTGQRKVASCVIPYISTLTGWELPMKVLE